MGKFRNLLIWPALLIAILDQASKLAVLEFIKIHEAFPITGFLNLVHVRNKGMAFGFMNRSDNCYAAFVLAFMTFAAIVFLLLWFLRLKDGKKQTALGLSLILGGAVGNLIDRLRFGEVVDFIDFYLGQYHWPAFNVADSAITVGTFWVAATVLLKNEK